MYESAHTHTGAKRKSRTALKTHHGSSFSLYHVGCWLAEITEEAALYSSRTNLILWTF